MRLQIILTVTLLLYPALAFSENRNEAEVVCPAVSANPSFTPFSFAKATMMSLWYARNAAREGQEGAEAAKSSENYLSLMTHFCERRNCPQMTSSALSVLLYLFPLKRLGRT